LIKPQKLNPGDKVATVSLSWGGAGDKELLWRYMAGKKRLEEEFGLRVVEMPNTLKGSDYIYAHPEKRASDLMEAFGDKSIKAVFSCIGGDESVRLLPYVNYDIIRENPKIFIGYSDTTVAHMICYKAGLSSFYGPCVLMELAENVEMHDYTRHWLRKVLFASSPIGKIEASPVWTSEYLEWEEKNWLIRREMKTGTGYELLQGSGAARGRLIGGCIEVLEMLKGTELWPSADSWKDSILFFETSEDKPDPAYFEYWLRNYGSQGIFDIAKGIILGKPYDNKYYEEYKRAVIKVIREELKLSELPILCNMNFGHTSPITILPYGAMAEIDCENKAFSILEPGVV